MDPMTKLNRMLADEREQTKLASALSGYSVEELEAVLNAEGIGQKKTANIAHPGHPLMQAALANKGKKIEKKSTMVKTSSLFEPDELSKTAQEAGKILAQMSKQASVKISAPGLGTPLMKGVSALGKGLGKVMGNTSTRNAAFGAAGGAAMGAAKGALDPNSSALGGAARGAAMGGALGLGAKEGVKAIGGMQNGVGRVIRGAARRGGTPI